MSGGGFGMAGPDVEHPGQPGGVEEPPKQRRRIHDRECPAGIAEPVMGIQERGQPDAIAECDAGDVEDQYPAARRWDLVDDRGEVGRGGEIYLACEIDAAYGRVLHLDRYLQARPPG